LSVFSLYLRFQIKEQITEKNKRLNTLKFVNRAKKIRDIN